MWAVETSRCSGTCFKDEDYGSSRFWVVFWWCRLQKPLNFLDCVLLVRHDVRHKEWIFYIFLASSHSLRGDTASPPRIWCSSGTKQLQISLCVMCSSRKQKKGQRFVTCAHSLYCIDSKLNHTPNGSWYWSQSLQSFLLWVDCDQKSLFQPEANDDVSSVVLTAAHSSPAQAFSFCRPVLFSNTNVNKEKTFLFAVGASEELVQPKNKKN